MSNFEEEIDDHISNDIINDINQNEDQDTQVSRNLRNSNISYTDSRGRRGGISLASRIRNTFMPSRRLSVVPHNNPEQIIIRNSINSRRRFVSGLSEELPEDSPQLIRSVNINLDSSNNEIENFNLEQEYKEEYEVKENTLFTSENKYKPTKLFSNLMKIKTIGYSKNMLIWVSEFQYLSESDVFDNDYRSSIVITIMNLSSEIISSIPNEILDNNNFINILEDTTTYLINEMYDPGYIWTFVPDDKLLWIFLMISCHYNPKVIPYVLSHPKFNKKILEMVDKYGMSCYHILSVNPLSSVDDMKLLINNENYDKKMLGVVDKNGYNLFMYSSIYNPNIFNYLLNLDDVTDEMIYKTVNGYNLLHMIIQFNNYKSLEIISNSKYMTKEFFEKLTSKKETCLMIASKRSYLIFEYLYLNSFSNEIENILGPQGTIFHISCQNHCVFDTATYLLNNNNVSKDIFRLYYPNYEYGRYSNCLFDSIENKELVNIIINHEYFNESMFAISYDEDTNTGYTIGHHLVKNDKGILLKELLGNDIYDNNFLKTTYDGLNLMDYALKNNSKMVKYILKSGRYTNEMLLEKYFGITVLENIIRRVNNEDLLEIILDKGITKELLFTESNSDLLINLLLGLHPKLIGHLLSSGIIAKDDFEKYDKNTKKSTIYRTMCYNCTNENILDILFRDDIFTIERFQNPKTFNNFVHYLINISPRSFNKYIDKIFKTDIYTKDITNNDKNILRLLLVTERYELFKTLIELGKYSANSLNSTNQFDYSILMFAIKKGNSDIIKYILSIQELTEENFTHTNSQCKNCLTEVLYTTPEIVKMVMDHQYFSNDIFNKITSHNNNYHIIRAIMSIGLPINSSCLKEMIKHPKFDSTFLTYKFKRSRGTEMIDNTLIARIMLKYPDIMNTIFENNILSEEQFSNIYDYIQDLNNVDIFDKIINHPYFDRSFILDKVECLYDFAINDNFNFVEKVLSLNGITLDMLLYKTSYKSFLEILFNNEKYDIISNILDMDVVCEELFLETVNTVPFIIQCAKRDSNLINKILSSDKLTEECFNSLDNKSKTILHIVDENVVNNILNHPFCTNEFVNKFDDEYSNCISPYICEDEKFYLILGSNKFSLKLLYGRNYTNLLAMMIYKTEWVLKLIEKGILTQEIFDMVNNYHNIFEITYRRNIDLFRILLKSKFVTKDGLIIIDSETGMLKYNYLNQSIIDKECRKY